MIPKSVSKNPLVRPEEIFPLRLRPVLRFQMLPKRGECSLPFILNLCVRKSRREVWISLGDGIPNVLTVVFRNQLLNHQLSVSVGNFHNLVGVSNDDLFSTESHTTLRGNR